MSEGNYGWTIWKFPLPVDKVEFDVAMPMGFRLSVQVQGDVPTMWYAVMPDTADDPDRTPRRFVWVAAGGTFPNSIKSIGQEFVATVQLANGLVLHLFEVWT